MYLYNSLSHKKELFTPIDPKLVKMYTCGPTVYHFAHIGNLRTLYHGGRARKVACAISGYRRQARDEHHGRRPSGTRDADTGEDKMLKGARREHKTVMEIAKFYTDAFFADCAQAEHQDGRTSWSPPPNCIAGIHSDDPDAAGQGLCLSRRAAMSILTPPSWKNTMSSTTMRRKTLPSACARASRRTPTSAIRMTSFSGSRSPSSRIRR